MLDKICERLRNRLRLGLDNNENVNRLTLFIEHAGNKITVRQTTVVCWK